MSTRSAVLGKFQSSVGNLVQNGTPVPTGYTYIAKSINVINGGAGGTLVQVALVDAGGVIACVLKRVTMANLDTFEWTGWAVMDPGDYLQFYSNAAGVIFWASGTKLLGVA